MEIAATCFVFWGGIWGAKLLAPLDIAPALFSKYRSLDSASTGVPANHHIIDQLTYDLPLQLTIYEAYRRGEIPWWDPYTLAGRPLLADAHINGTDPLRVAAYVCLPFRLAYNWTLIGHFLLSGVAMLLLLRHLAVKGWVCVLFAITFQFSSGLVLQFGHPWIQATFAYYPLLWISWDKWLERQRWSWTAAAAILVAAICYSGNLQSHSYLAIFTLAFVLGHLELNQDICKRLVVGVITSSFLGLCLAAPVLFNQLELFALATRSLRAPFSPWACLAGVASLSAVYPWAIGTFRTLDLSKLAGQGFHYGFSIFIGSPAFCLALFAMVRRGGTAAALVKARRTALWLIVIYLIIASTPLVNLFYLRCSGMAVMALIVLAAIGLAIVLENPAAHRWIGPWLITLAIACALITNIFALLVYPKFAARIKDTVLKQKSSRLDDAPALRAFQVESLPAEVSFRNPETVFATIGLIWLAVLLMNQNLSRYQPCWSILLILNMVPIILFASRFVPRQPVSAWQALLTGGPEQQKAASVLGNKPLRLYERAQTLNDYLFPNGMSHLYRIRTIHGYAALAPRTLQTLSDRDIPNREQFADYIYDAHGHAAAGQLLRAGTAAPSRFQWLGRSDRRFRIVETGLNQIGIVFEPGEAAPLLWADTRYPGWRGFLDGKPIPIYEARISFSQVAIPEGKHELVLRYQPRFLSAALWIATFSACAIAFTCGLDWLRARILACTVLPMSHRPTREPF